MLIILEQVDHLGPVKDVQSVCWSMAVLTRVNSGSEALLSLVARLLEKDVGDAVVPHQQIECHLSARPMRHFVFFGTLPGFSSSLDQTDLLDRLLLTSLA